MNAIRVRHNESSDFRKQLDMALAQHNDAQSHWHRDIRARGGEPLELEIREDDQLQAGLYGEIYWESLEIDRLWVAPDFRRQGLATALLERLEQLARTAQCRFIHLTTFSFQAPDLYLSLGYYTNGELTDFPPGFTKYWLRKDLDHESGTESGL